MVDVNEKLTLLAQDQVNRGLTETMMILVDNGYPGNVANVIML